MRVVRLLPAMVNLKSISLSSMLLVASFATAADAPNASKPVAPSIQVAKNKSNGDWKSLSKTQQEALAPLEKDWARLDTFRKEKWIELANRFSTMAPTDQTRMQERMRDWVELSPEQRRLARENYQRVKKLKVEKAKQWEQYQQLPEEKKKELAATVAPKKPLANPPRREVSKTSADARHQSHSATPAPASMTSGGSAHSDNEVSQSGSIPVQSSPSTP